MSAKHKAVAVPYEPKPREKAAIEAWRERGRVRGPSPKVKVGQKGDTPTIEIDHPDPETGGTLRLAAADLVDQDGLRTPHRRRRLEKPDAGPLRIGIRKPDEVIERDQARIVMP